MNFHQTSSLLFLIFQRIVKDFLCYLNDIYKQNKQFAVTRKKMRKYVINLWFSFGGYYRQKCIHR